MTGIFLLALGAPIFFIFALSMLRPLVMTSRSLNIPRIFRSVEIPLSDVSGVGLIYQYTPGSRSPSGWQLRVWNDTKQIRVPRWIVVTWRSPHAKGARAWLRTKTDWSQPLTHEEYSYLAASKPGLVARRIHDQALNAQGAIGKLETSKAEKTIRFDPNQSNITSAWWSPDGTMGRALGLPAPRPSNQLPVVGPVNRRKRALSALVLLGGGLVSLMVAGFIWDVQQSTSVHHPDGAQRLIITVGAIVLVLGLGLSVYFAVRLWRRPKAPVESTQHIHSTFAETGWSLSTTTRNGSPAPASSDVSIPEVKPEIRRARQRVAKFTLLAMPCYAAIGLLAALMLGRTGYLSSGETCAALLGPGSSHPSLACDAWRHHQLLLFLPPAGVLFVVALLIISFSVSRVDLRTR